MLGSFPKVVSSAVRKDLGRVDLNDDTRYTPDITRQPGVTACTVSGCHHPVTYLKGGRSVNFSSDRPVSRHGGR
jgi:hypothetical protein|tara:strand:- start:32 stop:253 length:222 start_codon:yes stop_codon:yes gene_type:complete